MSMLDYTDPNDPWRYDPFHGLDNAERVKAGCLGGMAYIAILLAALVVCILLGSCTTTKTVTVERHTTDTLRVTQYHRDSIYLSDSIYVSDFVRDDTVYKTVERWRTQYRDRWHTDTAYISHTDTVSNVYENIREVPAELTLWQRFRMSMGSVFLWLCAIMLAIWIWRKKP